MEEGRKMEQDRKTVEIIVGETTSLEGLSNRDRLLNENGVIELVVYIGDNEVETLIREPGIISSYGRTLVNYEFITPDGDLKKVLCGYPIKDKYESLEEEVTCKGIEEVMRGEGL